MWVYYDRHERPKVQIPSGYGCSLRCWPLDSTLGTLDIVTPFSDDSVHISHFDQDLALASINDQPFWYRIVRHIWSCPT